MGAEVVVLLSRREQEDRDVFRSSVRANLWVMLRRSQSVLTASIECDLTDNCDHVDQTLFMSLQNKFWKYTLKV